MAGEEISKKCIFIFGPVQGSEIKHVFCEIDEISSAKAAFQRATRPARPSPSQQAAKLAASYNQYQRSRREPTLAGTEVRLTSEERSVVTRHVWRAPPSLGTAPGPEEVMPQLPSNGLRIECVHTEPRETLGERVEVCRRPQTADDRQLASTFCHDGSMFLVFKRRATVVDFSRSI